MALLDRFRRAKPDDARAFAPPVYYGGDDRVGLVGNQSGPTETQLLGAVEGWQAIAARAIANRVSGLDLEVVLTTRVEDGTTADEILDDHVLNGVMKANPVFTMRQLLKLISYWITQAGEAYLLKVNDRMRVTRELWPMAPDRMRVIGGDRASVVSGYVYSGDGGEIRYERDEVIRIWDVDPASIFDSLGALGPQAAAYDTSIFADQTIRAHYERDAVPKVALTSSKDADPPPQGEERERFYRDWANRFDRKTGKYRGLPAILPPEWQPYEFSSSRGVGENQGMLETYRDRILMANGVPRSILGDVVDANRAAAETNQYVFDLHTIRPQADMIAEGLTMGLARDFDPRLSIRFANFVSADKAFELQAQAQRLTLKMASVNQELEREGFDPVEWGDEPIGTFSDRPYRPDEDGLGGFDDPSAFGNDEDPPDDDPDAEMEENEDTPRKRDVPAEPFSSQAAWVTFVKRERKWRKPFEKGMRRVLAQQRDAIISDLRELGTDDAALIIDETMAPEQWRTEFDREVEVARRAAFKEVAEDTLAGLGAEDRKRFFSFDEETLRVLEEQAAALVKHVNETTRRLLRSVLADEVSSSEGYSVDSLVKRVRSVFQTRASHARTIARTESLRATQQAQLTAFEQSGVVAMKRWYTAGDDKVRDTHSGIKVTTVPANEPFVLPDGDLADAPGIGHGGQSLRASNAINCRCYVVPVME